MSQLRGLFAPFHKIYNEKTDLFYANFYNYVINSVGLIIIVVTLSEIIRRK